MRLEELMWTNTLRITTRSVFLNINNRQFISLFKYLFITNLLSRMYNSINPLNYFKKRYLYNYRGKLSFFSGATLGHEDFEAVLITSLIQIRPS